MPTPAPEPEPTPAASGSEETLLAPLMPFTEGWPESLREDLLLANLTEARVALPVKAIEEALKKGKASFAWRTIRSWIKPPTEAGSALDNCTVELPLKVLAPIFLSRSEPKSKQKVSIDEEIPNLFFGFPGGDAPAAAAAPAADSPAAVTKPDTNYYVWDDTSDSAKVDEGTFKRKPSGTDFVSKYATPNEVVSRAAALDGVAGALIALPDGLMVASKLSPELNPDTLAAFLPHIFGKVSQCTKELRMGDLNNLNFTVGNTPWKIFRVNAIFFAVFGRPGQPMPTTLLSALAAELDHKK